MAVSEAVREKVRNLPTQPGVYLWKDEKGKIIYVGKAVNLRNRVTSYVRHDANRAPKVAAMVSHAADLETIVVATEMEALILENTLIKKYHPHYNIMLRDDKTYPYIKVTVQEDYPRIFMTRRVSRDGARYFGPFADSTAVHRVLKLMQRAYHIRSCRTMPTDRPCLQYHLHHCDAPCVHYITKADYGARVRQALDILEGRDSGISRSLQQQMEDAAESMEFEKAAMYRDQQPVSGPLTLSDAMARALKYNLDYRLKMMETALSRGILDISQQDMLPKLMTDAGYRWRDNDSGGTSVGIEDRVVSLRPSTSEEREHLLADATFSWDVLDFGMSYYRAKQQADNVNIAEERRRKVLQNIVQEVRDAYWRALGAQRLLSEAQPLAEEIQTALEKTREAERAGILPPVEGLEYQRALLDAVALLNQKRQEMQMAKSELAALLNLPSTTDFTLQDVANPALSGVPSQLDTLEQMALERRPELREEDYKPASTCWKLNARSPRCSRT